MWLPEGMLRECIVEADRHAPLETGGTFMGYWIGTSAVVVTCLVGAGPGAERGVRHFAPDQDWQVAEIARCYERSGRMNTYVGDWHSHPGAQDGELSRKDRRVLRRIVETPAARAPRPAMAVLHGSGAEGRTMTVWFAEAKARPLLWPGVVIRRGALQVF